MTSKAGRMRGPARMSATDHLRSSAAHGGRAQSQNRAKCLGAATTSPRLLLAVAAAVVLLAAWNAAYAQGDDLLTVTYIDQETEGESTLIIFPNDDVLLIDGGVKSSFRNHVAPVLAHHGISVIDLVIATHKDTDHLNGINALLGDGRHTVREVWFSPPIEHNTRTTEFYGHVDRLGTPLSYPTTGTTRAFGDVVIEVLHPQRALQFGSDDNANSIVTLLKYGEMEFLFTGDIEGNAESSILRNIPGDKLDVDIMNAPHHGSETSSTAAFIAATSPELVIYGAHARDGGKDKHDNPDDDVIARYKSAGARQLQTGLSGDIVIRTNGSGCTLIFENGASDACFAGIMTVEDSNAAGPASGQAPDASEPQVPPWLKTTAGYWVGGQISDDEFVGAVQFLVAEGVIITPPTTPGPPSDSEISSWIKLTAGHWVDGQISDDVFVEAIQFMIIEGIIVLSP